MNCTMSISPYNYMPCKSTFLNLMTFDLNNTWISNLVISDYTHGSWFLLEEIWKIVSNFVPFLQYLGLKIQVESMQPFTILDAGYNYSHAGLRLYFVRYKIGGLMSGFFGPTGLFALLSMISFGISPEVVRNVHNLQTESRIMLWSYIFSTTIFLYSFWIFILLQFVLNSF